MNTPYTPPDIAAFRRRLAKADPVLAGVIRAAGKYTVEPSTEHTPFHALASAITHQQLNGTAAMSIFNRFCGLYSEPQAEGETALLEAHLGRDPAAAPASARVLAAQGPERVARQIRVPPKPSGRWK